MYSRRTAISSLIGLVSTPSLVCCQDSATKIVDLSVVELAAKLKKGELSSEEIVRAFLEKIAKVNETINAVVQLRPEDAIREARQCDERQRRGANRPLRGIPFTVKDSLDTAELISTAGTLGRRDFTPEKDAAVVRRLKNAGGILLGKTNTPELTLSYDTTNPVYGRTKNPHRLDHSPGGSSGGAAAILAASGSPLDVASDSAGSIRIPAHYCGIAGLKPTAGRVPRTGHIISFAGPLQALTQIGPMARYVGDLRYVFPILAGPDGTDPHIAPVSLKLNSVDRKQLRIGYFAENQICQPTPDTSETIQNVAAALKSDVKNISNVFPKVFVEAARLYRQLVSADGFDWVGRLLAQANTRKSSLGMLRNPPAPVSPDVMVKLHEKWDQVRSQSLQIWRHVDALICPVAEASAFQIGTPPSNRAFSYSSAMNVLGWPSVVVRAGTSQSGMPIGVQVIAAPWREDIALSIAERIEEKLGGWKPI